MQYKRSKKEIEYCEYLSMAIKKLRQDRKKSMNCLAFDSLLSSATLCRIENNQNTPHITKIAQVAYGLGVPLSELIIEMEKILPKNFILADET